jgi:hypothetical protein
VVGEVLAAYGATVIAVDETKTREHELVEFIAKSGATVVFHGNDKKRDLLIHAAVARTVKIVSSTWVEDCIMLGETLPIAPPYVPTAKLLATLLKKFEKREK